MRTIALVVLLASSGCTFARNFFATYQTNPRPEPPKSTVTDCTTDSYGQTRCVSRER